ncbi:MAG: glycoside hydrolase family 97 protein [Phaeodactylibacter sp.]|nr:glycoside hydrolase family 97 protein [Phaeodactylibacter sp.]MCB9048220.1 glycoside hydrolase family 97 protein [Lewinellaceae bacterium]
MKNLTLLSSVFLALLFSCQKEAPTTTLQSPQGLLQLEFFLSDTGVPQYILTRNGATVIDTSGLGFNLRESGALREGFAIVSTQTGEVRESWTPVWGTQKEVLNHYNELFVELSEKGGQPRKMNIRFRLFDDGLGFRYEFPEQEAMKEVTLMDEYTQFRLTGDHLAWWIPADYDSYEYLYNNTRLSEVDTAGYHYNIQDRADRFIANPHAVNTPVTMKTDDGLYLSFHEANLTDYAEMTLGIQPGNLLQSELVPWSDGTKVRTKTPFVSPWRTVLATDTPGALLTSNLLLNLNEPSQINDVSWIEPMKYTGIWWELHLGITSWSLRQQAGSWGDKGGSGHGATTENTRKYIDFNAENNIRGLLIEGWNLGWEYWGQDTLGYFNFYTPYPDFDIEALAEYAKSKNVALIGHHETGGQADHYESQLEKAFEFYNKLGIKAVKTGYAGPITPKGERHHGQYMVRHHRKVIETAAKYQIMINAHEPVKQTGLQRTWPNLLAQEGVRGMEYNAWSDGNPPSHTCIIPFTRMLAGPIDYTPGIFDITFDKYKPNNRVYTTLAKQLALYVTIYSPLQMAADLPEHYTGHPAFQFIREVGVDWDDTRILNAEIGQYLTVARKEKGTNKWFVGSITNEEPREFTITLDFLDDGKAYRAAIYKDSDTAHWKDNPMAFVVTSAEVKKGDTMAIKLAPGGGQAVSILPVE